MTVNVPEYRVGDTWPPLSGTVTDAAGATVNISTALSIKFVGWLQPTGALTIGTAGVVTNLDDNTAPNKGRWQYVLASTDLAPGTPGPVGIWEGEIEVTWATGKVESFPSDKGRAPTFKVTGD